MRVLLITLGLFAVLASSAAAQTPDPRTCEGYPETRQFIDVQSWWNLPGQAPAHAHIGSCLPERENHTGDIRFDVRMVMHNMPSDAVYRYLAFVVKGPGYERTIASFDPKFRCEPGVHTCEKWFTYTLPISSFSKSGLQEIRIRTSVSPVDGNSVRPSINWPTYIWNGKTREDQTRMPYLRAKGWYGDDRFFGYCEANYRSDVTPLPDDPVTSNWAPRVQLVDHADGDVPPTWHEARIDPDFHADPPKPGTLLRSGLGGWEGTLFPAAGMAPGPHKLFMRADCEDERGTNGGVLIVPFTVQGDAPAPEPTPQPTPQPSPQPTPQPSPVTGTSPAAGSTVTGTIVLNASVPAGTTRVSYRVDGVEVAYDASASDFSERWSTAEVANGRHTLVARATVNGSPVDSQPITFTVSN
jgi:hypothetical protein